jgi:hypothetical protein
MLIKQKKCFDIMKRIFMFLLIIVLMYTMSYAASITITNPSSGLTIYKGSSLNITWTKSGSMNANVKIRLYRGSTKVLNITDSTPNNGSYTWRIPESLSNGSYIIRVKTVDNAVYDNSDAFNIVEAFSVGSSTIRILQPSSGLTLHKGSSFNITWTKSGSMNANVKIRLYRGSTKVLNITDSTPNNGSYTWRIPESLSNGSYIIRVKTVDNEVFDDSATFEIGSGVNLGDYRMMHKIEAPHSIEILSPNRSERIPFTLDRDETIRIRWKSKNLTNNLKISLYNERGVEHVINDHVNKEKTSYTWRIMDTKNVYAGYYYSIRIEEKETKVYDKTDFFYIRREKHIDLSCRFLPGYRTEDRGSKVTFTVKVKAVSPYSGTLNNVPVTVIIREIGRERETEKSQTKYLRKVVYGRHPEYSLSFTFTLYRRHRSHTVVWREAIAIVDPEDIFRDKDRSNNRATKTFQL